jgi:hypothetical protein
MDTRSELEEIARQYRDQGYEVALQPRGEDLPESLDGLEPDLIARTDDETVIVQVKSREDLGRDHRLQHLAARIHEQPGWRLDFVVSSPQRWPDDVPTDALERNDSELRVLVQTASSLLLQGELEAAHLIAWSAMEGAMRELARQSVIELESKDPPFILKTLYSEGPLSRGDYKKLDESRRIRNAVAHGLRHESLTPRLVQFTVKATERLLARPQARATTGASPTT